MLDKKTRYKLHTLIQNTKMRQTFIVLASIICTINSFKLGERGTRGAMIGLDKYQCDMLGITHINYSWGNFQFETLTQVFLQPIIAGLAMEAIKAKTHTVPWRGILALFGEIFFFARIFFLMIFLFLRWLSYPAHPGLLLQLRQHDDLTWPPTWGDNTGLWIMASYWSLLASYSQLPASDWQSFLPSFSNNLFNSIFRQHGSPDLTYADFIVVQSVWGMTQGLIMTLSGYISRWHNVIIIVMSCHHVIIISQWHNIIIMSSWCHHDVNIMSIKCHQNVIKM